MPQNTVILLIRHAEKPEAGWGLSPEGEKHAQAYVRFFKNYHLGSKLLTIDALFAAADKASSKRPRLTLVPLAEALNLPIQTTYGDGDIGKLAAHLLSDKASNKTVLISWRHGEILELAEALGASAQTLSPKTKWPRNWPDEEFRWILQIAYDAEGRLDRENTYCVREPAITY